MTICEILGQLNYIRQQNLADADQLRNQISELYTEIEKGVHEDIIESLENHDCHASEEDGCDVCNAIY